MGGIAKTANPLRHVPCLRTLDPVLLGQIHAAGHHSRLRRGEILFREGEVCEEIVVIITGSIKVYRLSDDGRQQTLWVLGAGDCFCLAPLFHQARYPVTAQCMTDARILKLRRENTPAQLGADPGLASGVVRCLCDRLAAVAFLAEVASTRNVRQRLAGILLDLARRRGYRTADGTLLDIGLTHDELAACAGTAREVVSRTLQQFQREGLVRLARRRMVILDLRGLQALLVPHPPAKDATR
jgi:CRP/FNR family transcriptional regulator